MLRHSQPGAAARRRGEVQENELEVAETELKQALEFFDGEDLNGEAWTRAWLGGIALERGNTEQAVAWLEGATHGCALPVASLFLGEAFLRAKRYRPAEHELERAARAVQPLGRAGNSDPIVDAKWGDELPLSAFRARILRALAEARFMAPGGLQDGSSVRHAEALLKRARKHLRAARFLAMSVFTTSA